MKKLIIATAALCAAVSMADGISSANVVGYQEKAVVEGNYNYMVATFDKVNAETSYTLADIGVNSDFVISTLSFLDTDSSTKTFVIDGFEVDQFFYYFESDLVDTAFEGQPGWYFADEDTGDLHSANSIAVNAGDMFYIEGAEDAEVLIPSAL